MSSWPSTVTAVAAMLVALLTFLHNRRTLKAAQPKVDAERQGVDIDNLRKIIAELRQANADDRVEFDRLIRTVREEAHEAHDEAVEAQRALHLHRNWYLSEDAPWHLAVLAELARLDPQAAKNLPPRVEPPMWPEG